VIDGEHIVTVKSGRKRIPNWTSYDISIDMLRAGDAFSLEIAPADPIGEEFGDVWAAVVPDSLVEVYLDDVRILSGFIDERSGESSPEGDRVSISGRAKDGRLLDESAPLLSFKGLTLEDVVRKLASPWFERVELSNAENRALTIGQGRGARGGRVWKEPHHKRRKGKHHRMYRKVEPGETRQAVLEYFLRENEVIAWASADGKSMIVGSPNYDQEPTFSLFHGRAMSPRGVHGNCATFKVTDSVGERYSMIIATGTGSGTATAYTQNEDGSLNIDLKKTAVKRRGTAKNGPGPDGIGKDFQRRKVLLVPDDGLGSNEQAQTRAEREMAERDARGHELTVSVFGHSQLIGFHQVPAIYACDTIARVESEVFGVKGDYLITSVRFTRDRTNGEMTTLQLVPKGTILKV